MNLDARSSKIDVLADVRPEVVELAELHTLLAKDVVGSGGNVDALARAETD